MSVFTGAGVAIITPMKANGEVNYEKLGEFIDYQIENSTDAIVICGTTGEASTLTHEEHIETIRFAADHVKKRVPVIAGTGSNGNSRISFTGSAESRRGCLSGCNTVLQQGNTERFNQALYNRSKVCRFTDYHVQCAGTYRLQYPA